MEEKIKVMCISCTGNHKLKILVEGQRMEQVTQFKYLGSIISILSSSTARIATSFWKFGYSQRFAVKGASNESGVVDNGDFQ